MPEPILNSGIELILRLQSLGSWLTIPMEFFTFLGDEEFYLLIAPALYWCVDAALGLRIGLYLGISSALNSALKLALHEPRPYWYDPRVQALAPGGTFGIPSGHAQNAVVIWGRLASALRGSAAWGAALFLILAIGASRPVVGAHFPSDVIAGWIIGALLLWALFAIEGRIEPVIRNWSARQKLIAALGTSLLIILVGAFTRASLAGWSLPEAWVQNARLAAPGEEAINPLSLTDFITSAAVFFGLTAGAIWNEANIGLDVRGPLLQRVLRYLVGTAGILAVWAGLDAVFPEGETLVAFGFRYLRYTMVALWITGGAPLVFIRLGLAQGKRAAE